MPVRKSIVLITVDCLRADHCGFMGYARLTTPFLDGLARESFLFPAAIVGGVPTYYSFPATLASRYPLFLGRDVVGLGLEEKNLASVCKENGYATAFFGAGNPYLAARFGYDFGFDIFRDFLDNELTPASERNNGTRKRGLAGEVNRLLESVSHKIPGLGAVYDELYFQYCQRWAAPTPESLDTLRRFPAADVIVEQASKWLASIGGKPFCLWLHFMDPHSPYYPTEKGIEILGGSKLTPFRARYLNGYWNRDLGSDRLRRYHEEIVEMYDAGIAWVDAQIARLVEALRYSNLWDNCTLAFTADHGEEFLEHGRRYHAPSLVEELIQVPLVVRVPGAQKQAVTTNPFSLLDLAPTLLSAAELPVPSEFQGQSRWHELQEGTAWDAPAIAECIAGCTNPVRAEQRRGARLLAVREARYKLVLNFETQTDCLFDLEADPREQSPLPASSGKQERRRLLDAAHTHLRKAVARENSPAHLRTRLREIGLSLAGADFSG